MKIENLGSRVKLSKSKTEIEASLQNFKIYDKSASSLYTMIAECTGDQVLDVSVTMFDMLTDRQKELGQPDIMVKVGSMVILVLKAVCVCVCPSLLV